MRCQAVSDRRQCSRDEGHEGLHDCGYSFGVEAKKPASTAFDESELTKLLELIQGPGLCGGLTTYRAGTEGDRKLYASCAELERRGFLRRQTWDEWPDCVGFAVVKR